MQEKSIANRYLRLPRPQQFLIIVVLCGAIFVALECLTWVGLYAVWRASGKVIIPVEFISEFQPFSSKQIFEPRSEYKPYYMSGLLPNLKVTRRTAFATDQHGLLINNKDQSDRDLTVPSDGYRIFIFGNSTVMGQGTGRSISAFLESSLNSDNGGKFEVITAGGDGFNTGQELARLALETLHYHPNMIITFNGVADAFWSSFSNNSRPNANIISSNIKKSLNQISLQSRSFVEVNTSSIDFFFRRFYIYNTLLSVLSKIGIGITNPYDNNDQTIIGSNLANSPEYRPEGVQVYLGNLMSMSAVSNVRGIRTLHILQPTLATELIRREERATSAEWELLELKNLGGNYTRRHRAFIFDRFYDQARSGFERQAQGPRNSLQTWIDLSHFFRDVDDLADVYTDAVHYHEHHTEEIAEEIAVQVRRALAKPAVE